MRTIYSLNDGWSFTSTAPEAPVELPVDWRQVRLPHSWNAFDGQDGGQDYLRTECFYARRLDLPEAAATSRFWLEFEGVAVVARVWVNGTLLATHEGSYAGFRVDITDAVNRDGANLLVVSADNRQRTDIYPQTADFTFYGGVYREVSLIVVEPTHFDLSHLGGPGVRFDVAVDGDDAAISATTWVTEPQEGDAVALTILDEDDAVVAEAYAPAEHATSLELTIRDAHRWHGTADPYLYTAVARLVRRNEVLDEVSCRIGVREYAVDPQRGFLLNGELVPLRGVSRHQDRLGKGNALTFADHLEDAELIAELGANTVRLAHYQHSQDFYDLCDEYGFVVWAEIPFISVMSKDPAAHANARQQMQELITQNVNHPSICFWGISNEITIGGDSPELVERLRDLDALVKSMDPSRPTTMAQLSMVPIASEHNQISDVLSYNHYFGWYNHDLARNAVWLDEFHAAHPDRALGISEYGAEGVLAWHTENPQMRDYSETYQARYHEHMCQVIEDRPWLWATHVWNMFDFGVDSRDEGGVAGRNNKGLVTFDRSIRKDAFYACKAYWSDEPFVHVAGRRFAQRDVEGTTITVYSNRDEVALLVDGQPVGSARGHRVFRFADVRLPAGRHVVEAVAGQLRDTITLEAVTDLGTRYDLPGAEPGGDVPNWFDDLDAAAIELTFDAGRYSIRDEVKVLVASEPVRAVLLPALSTLSGMKLDAGMLGIMGDQTLESLLNGVFSGSAEQVAVINRELQRIPR